MKRYLKWILIPGALVLSPVIILAEICIVFFVIGSIFIGAGNLRDWQTKNEIFAYVLENKDIIQIDAVYGYQQFEYTYTGFWDASVEFGYYYSPDDTYYHVNPTAENKYRKGYRVDGPYDDPVDWYYTEKICDHWYYYEFHDG